MATWPKDRPLEGDLVGDPVVWQYPVNWSRPSVIDEDFDVIFQTSPRSTGHRLATFGHGDPSFKGKPHYPHFLATRGTTPMHHDPAYPRWSVQIALYNEGLGLTGRDGKVWELPLGTLYCLDTHSPHQVVIARMIGRGARRQKLQGAIDYTARPEPYEEGDYDILREYVETHHPAAEASKAR